ncbi:MAG: hypothetical protein ACAI25_04080 [Planctomycetota bacterium]
MFLFAKPCRAPVLVGAIVLATSGCMTPQMARKIDEHLGLAPIPVSERRVERRRSAFDDDSALPAHIWYCDEAAKIYHERRTNTYLAFDPVHDGWGAIPEDEASTRGFKPERAKLLPSGPPEPVRKVIDYLTEMEPGWRGS